MSFSLSREVRSWIKKTKGTVTFRPGPNGGILVLLTTPPAASVRRVDITTSSPEMVDIGAAFSLARHRHTVKCAAATCISRQIDGRRTS